MLRISSFVCYLFFLGILLSACQNQRVFKSPKGMKLLSVTKEKWASPANGIKGLHFVVHFKGKCKEIEAKTAFVFSEKKWRANPDVRKVNANEFKILINLPDDYKSDKPNSSFARLTNKQLDEAALALYFSCGNKEFSWLIKEKEIQFIKNDDLILPE